MSNYIQEIKLSNSLQKKHDSIIKNLKVSKDIEAYKYEVDCNFKFTVKKINLEVKEIHLYEERQGSNTVVFYNDWQNYYLEYLNNIKSDIESCMDVESPRGYTMICFFDDEKIRKDFLHYIFLDLEQAKVRLNRAIDSFYNKLEFIDSTIINFLKENKGGRKNNE